MKNKIEIGENSIVGAGSVVIRDLPDDCTASYRNTSKSNSVN